MIKKIVHIADVHIQNFQRIEEFNEGFEKLYSSIKEQLADTPASECRIIIAGDLVHQKNTVSNELNVTVANFLRSLSDICPVLVISGNHDLVVNNNVRMDTLTGIFETAKFTNCRFLDKELNYKSGVIEDDDVAYALYSIWEDYKAPEIPYELTVKKTPIIGLFHGPVVGSALPNKSVIGEGIDPTSFSGCDFIIAGDIHKRQVVNVSKQGEETCELVYAGSTFQQNIGETVSEHGYVVWTRKAKNAKVPFSHEYVDLNTDYGMYKVAIGSIEDIDQDKEEFTNL